MVRARSSLIALLLLGCSSGPVFVGDDRRALASAGAAGNGGTAGAGGEAGATAEAGSPSAGDLLALLEPCRMISNGLLARQPDYDSDVAICGLRSAVYWKSELAVDCDGKRSDTCNQQTDPQSSSTTQGKDSNGESLDPAQIPYVEVPQPSRTFDYTDAGLSMGSVVALVYRDRVVYGVIGNEQEADVIGAASYAMADRLGINPDPVSGGIQSKDVTYIAFAGASHVVPALEDVPAAAELGQSAAADFVAGR